MIIGVCGGSGSGKTTLLNRILTEEHGRRIAVIENEFGEVGIDQGLVINADEEVFEMSNGCICCTVRGDLIRVLGNLMKRRDKFDYVLVETTGLADLDFDRTHIIDFHKLNTSNLWAVRMTVHYYNNESSGSTGNKNYFVFGNVQLDGAFYKVRAYNNTFTGGSMKMFTWN